MKYVKIAAALTDLDADLTPKAKVDSRMDSSSEDACLLSSGSWVRIPPGTPSRLTRATAFPQSARNGSATL